MMYFMDRTFCVSEDCKNECGRQLTKELEEQALKSGMLVAFSYFCGKPDTEKDVLNDQP